MLCLLHDICCGITAAGGVRALYAGLSPTLARAFPANAAQWLAWELCMQQMQQWGGGGGAC
jgi:hypothetical protein